jgi:hypothetical protein
MINQNIPRLPGRQIALGEKPTLSAISQDYTTFVAGSVMSVDEEKLCVSVKLRGNLGVLQNVSISQPFAGNSSFILGVPEVGSLVLVGMQGNNDSFILTYLPNYTHGLENRNIKKLPDNVITSDPNESFFRVKKLNRGEVALGSSGGMELFLGDYFSLDDRFGNKFLLRSDENSLLSTACNNSVFSSGVWTNSGIIKRNSIDPSIISDLPNIVRVPLLNGRYGYSMKPGGSDPNVDPYFTEYLLEVEDKGYAQPPQNDMNGDSNRTIRRPIAIFSMGNFVGNNPSTGSYGRMLKPMLFHDVDDITGDFSLDPALGSEIDTYGIAMSWFKPERTNAEIGAFYGVDKEGHFFHYLPAATAGGLGKGRSMSILARGSKKEVWGNDTRYATSWDMTTTGGIVWRVGTHNERDGSPHSNRSIDTRTSSSVFYMYGSQVVPEVKDFDKSDIEVTNLRDYFKIEKIGGRERHEVSSTRETILKGSDKLRIEGARTEQIIGANTTSVGSNMNIVVGDAFTEKVTKEKQETYGNRKTTITSGSSELTIKSLNGNIKEEIEIAGSRTVKIKLGDIKETIVTGSRTFKTTAGNYKVQTTTGNIQLTTKAGKLSFQTKVGKAEIKSTTGIDIKTNPVANVNIQGGSIKLKGKTAVMSGVITSKTHLDYITGAPLKGSSSVKATI